MKSKLVMIIGISGSGKSEMVKALLKRIPNSTRLITCTTRPPRPGEIDKKDFYFLTKETFKERVNEGDFIEYAEVHGYLYGSSKKILEQALTDNLFVFVVIDVQGAQSLKKLFPDSLAVFMHSGTIEEMKERLKVRQNQTREELEKRLKTAEFELGFKDTFDAVIENKDGQFDQAVEDMTKLLI